MTLKEARKEYERLKREAPIIVTCTRCERSAVRKNMDPHHTHGRATPESMVRFIWLCRPCHNWVHNNPNEARKAGLLK